MICVPISAQALAPALPLPFPDDRLLGGGPLGGEGNALPGAAAKRREGVPPPDDAAGPLLWLVPAHVLLPAQGLPGLCGQPEVDYYFATCGKPFRLIINSDNCTSYKADPGAKASKAAAPAPRHVLQVRAAQGEKLRALYRSLGWSRLDAAKFFQVTERTLHNWESGRTATPAAYLRLLRIHCGMELPGAAWAGWSISRGKLCTPEGHELDPRDARWWALLVRRAEVGVQALAELAALKHPHHLPQGSRLPPARGAPRSGDARGRRAGACP